MTPELLVAILVALIGSAAAVLSFLTFLINRKDTKKKEDVNFYKKMDRLEKDGLRLQLLVLILMIPDETQEIMTVAKHYFGDLKGDWYMTSLFNKWAKKHNIEIPIWSDDEK